MNALYGKTALVTGASRGLGRAFALALAGAGASVVLAARNAQACRTLAQEIEGAGGAARAVACDVTRYDDLESAVDTALRRFGGLDILINNAGLIEPLALLGETNPARWAENVAVNLTGAYHGIRAALPVFKKAGSGVIVNLSTSAAVEAYEGWSAYCAAKAGLAMLTRCVAFESGGDGIQVYGFGPGPVDTDMQTRIRASDVNHAHQIPKENLSGAETAARVLVWLCAGGAPELSGSELSARDPEIRRRAGIQDVD